MSPSARLTGTAVVFVGAVLLGSVVRDAAGQPVFKRIADVNTHLPEGDLGDTFSAFDISRSSLSGTWTAFYAEGVDSDTGFEAGIYSNRGNRLGTVGDTHDTFGGGDVLNMNQPLIENYVVYVSPVVSGPGASPGIASSPYNHELSDIGGGEAIDLVGAGPGGGVFPLVYHTGGSIESLAGVGGSGTSLVAVGDGVGPARVNSVGDFDFSAASGLIYDAELESGLRGLFAASGGALSTLVDNNTEIPGTGVNFDLFDAPVFPGGNFQAAFVGGRGSATDPNGIRGIYAIDQGGDVVALAQRGQPASFGINPGNWVSFDPVLAPDDAALGAVGSGPRPQFAFRGSTENFRGVFLVDALTGDISPAYLEPDTFRFQGEGSTEFFAFNTAIGRDALHNGKILVSGDVSELGVFPFQNTETVFIIDSVGTGFGFPGSSQDDPIMPDNVDPDGSAHFDDAPSGMWFDPPLIDGYAYQVTDDSLFVAILDFPTGFASPLEVLAGGQSFGLFEPGDQLVFPGDGVSSFTIRGIMPPDDAADGADFPLQIAFDSPTADFTMTPIPVPEPTALALCIGMLCFGAGTVRAAHRSRQDAPVGRR